MLSFIKDFKKAMEKLENVNLEAKPPSKWFGTGNLAVNRVISGSYIRGVPQGRVTAFVGPSDSGKSFMLTNAMACAQADGAFVLAIDSENALDLNYLRRVGVNTSEETFQYVGVVTVQDVVEVVSEFISGYIKAYGKYNDKAPYVFMAIDSLSMLLTEAENENFESGEQRGDQGQQAKQIKQFLKTMTSRMKMTNMCLGVTAHVYGADPLKGEGLYSVTPALRYSCSQIVLITKLKLKDENVKDKKAIAAGNNITGIRLKAETFKSRFSKIGTKVEIEVPYDKGINPYDGILDMMLLDEVVTQNGAWYTCKYVNPETGEIYAEKKFMEKQIDKEIVEFMLSHPKLLERESYFMGFTDSDEEEQDASQTAQ